MFGFVFLYAEISSRTQVIMSTFVTISAPKEYEEYLQKGFEIVKSVENSLSSYKKGAVIYKLNENKKAKLDDYAYEALKLSSKYYKDTNAYFDITIGSITKDIYRFGEDEYLASKEELSDARVDFKALRFDKEFAYILRDDVKIDLGGMGKGFAVDKVAQYLKKEGVKDAVVSASGDIRCFSECNIYIQDPFSEGVLMSFTTLKKDLSISTSGTYNRYVKDQKNNHLIDPKQKRSQHRFLSITLVGELANSDLDAYATAASVMTYEEAYEFLDSIGVAYVVVGSDSKIVKGGKLSLIKSDAIKQ